VKCLQFMDESYGPQSSLGGEIMPRVLPVMGDRSLGGELLAGGKVVILHCLVSPTRF
jgi:hypothetical protein